MKSKKTTVNLSYANLVKLEHIKQETGLNQSEIINQAIAKIPIIALGNQKSLAESFFEIQKLLASNHTENINKEVNEVCQYLNLLMAKIEEMMLSKAV